MEHYLVVGIVQSLFTAIFLSTKPSTNLSDKLLAVWMIFIAMPLIGGASIHLWPDLHIPLLRADLIYPLTYGPFLWLYVRSLSEREFKFELKEIGHFLPFIGVSGYQLATGWSPAPPNPEITQLDLTTRIIGISNLSMMSIYSGFVANRLIKHQVEIEQQFSAFSNQVTLKWLYWLSAAIPAVFILLFVASTLSLPTLLKIHLPVQILIIFAMSYFGLMQTQVFNRLSNTYLEQTAEIPVGAVTEDKKKPSKGKEQYSRSGLDEERAARISKRLAVFMENEKPYLSPDLTISDLAKKISVPRHHLTEVISTLHDKNFYVFVNEYRIDAVKRAITDPQNSGKNLIDLAYSCGFNSKPTFNAAFKRLTGVTPSQFRSQPT